MKFFFYLYVALLFWFFFWLRPRVEDGRLELIIEKYKKRNKNK
jgi:hypothetical protein